MNRKSCSRGAAAVKLQPQLGRVRIPRRMGRLARNATALQCRCSGAAEGEAEMLQKTLQQQNAFLRRFIQEATPLQQQPAPSASRNESPEPPLVAGEDERLVVEEVAVEEVALEEVSVEFVVDHHVQFGQRMFLLGSLEQLGAWELERAVPMEWSSEHRWRATVSLEQPQGVSLEVEYKVLILPDSWPPKPNDARWQPGPNRSLQLPAEPQEGSLTVRTSSIGWLLVWVCGDARVCSLRCGLINKL